MVRSFLSYRTFAKAVAVLPLTLACSDFSPTPDRIPGQFGLDPFDTVVVEGQAAQLRATVYDRDGNPFEYVPPWAIQWTVSDPAAATVSPDGLVQTQSGGELFVDGKIGDLPAKRVRLRVNPSEVRLWVGAHHLTQGIQNVGGTVRLIAGREALLRVFLVGEPASFYSPQVRAVFVNGGSQVHEVLMDIAGDVTPTQVQMGLLDRSYNATIPGSVLQPGVEMYIEVDPAGIVPLAAGSQPRVPASGSEALDVVEPPLMTLTVVPSIYGPNPLPTVFLWTDGLTAESQQLDFTRDVMPIGEMEVMVHDTFTTYSDLTTSDGWGAYLREMDVLRSLEGEIGYYYGVITLPGGSPYGGLGYVGYPVSVGNTSTTTVAHEIGHNMNLRHAECGGPSGVDPAFPHDGGSIGDWGYDSEKSGIGGLLSPDEYKDLMSYCGPRWISDYHFERALTHRLANEPWAGTPGQAAQQGPMLVVWGETRDGVPQLEPSFVADGHSRLPLEPGPYRLTGRHQDGSVLFDYSFSPVEVEFGGGHFTFTIPMQAGWDEGLAEVVVTGPAGESVIQGNGEAPALAVVRHPSSGQVTAIVRDVPNPEALAAGGDVLLSDGLRTFRILEGGR